VNHHIRHDCRLCSGPLTIVLNLPDTPLANSYSPTARERQQHYPLFLSQCDQCGHVQLPVVVAPELMFSDYAYTSSTAASFRKHVGALADSIAGPGGFLVDFGSNDGLLLSEAQKRGMRAIGIDPALNLASEATKRGQITLPAFVTPSLAAQLRNIIGEGCTVTALNMFAHADDLGAIVDAAKELIRPNGVFIFEVAYLFDVLAKNEIGTIYHEHTSHHHVAPLVEFFRLHGMSLERVERLSSQGGSIRGYARVGGFTAPQVTAMALDERIRLPDLLAAWPERIRQEQSALHGELEPYRARGLAVYGAPARLTTYAYTMNMHPGDVSCVFDDEPRKVGRFTPGLHWPIVPSSELMARNPPAVLISAWPYAREIMAKFPDYQGKWIVPRREA
jgi:SAM-dependent methyltransferase